ncbi:type IV pilus assembly protein PilM [Candidatus Saccharibacteria bacterium]|nr:type IV pilus assembly protein PilM [Candidatus Saccharibacteria bacterium]
MGTVKFYKDEPLFGLDIGHASLKAMQMEVGAGQACTVIGYGISHFEAGSIQNGVITDPEAIAKAMHELFEKNLIGKITSQRVACSLPTAHTFSRPMTIPATGRREIFEAINLEAEQYIPIPLTSLYLDYEIIRQDQDQTEVLVVAASKNIVDSYFKVLERLNLQPVAFEPSINAASRLLQMQGVLKSEPTIIIDIGSITTDIAVFDKTLLVASTVNSGSDNITHLISQGLHLTPKQANDFKNQSGIAYSDHQQRIIDAIKPVLETLVHEIQKSVRYYAERATKSGSKITQLVIVGGGSVMPGLNQYLAKEVRLSSQPIEPWQNIKFGSLSMPPDVERAVYITAAGEAVLRPQEVLK